MAPIKKITLVFILFCGMFFSTFFSEAQIPNDITTGFEMGNAKMLSGYFNQNVYLVVLDNNNVYSKAQAQQIVNDFFSVYTPNPKKKFTIIHESGKEEAKSVIGSIETTKGEVFRIYFLLKEDEGKKYIHQLRIEKQ